MSSELIIWIVVAVIALSLGIACSLNECPFMAFMCGLFLGASVLKVMDEMDVKPTAMDVVQGRTTMKYGYIDGIKVDSTVVFIEDYIDED